LHLSASPLRLASDCSRTDNSEIQDLASPWDTIPIPAQDATQQRSAATTRQEASLGAKGVTNHTTDTRTSKHPDFNPQVTQPTRRHTSCKPDGREHGHAHHPHPRRTQPASAIGPYDPCKTANVTAAIWPGGNARAKFRALTPACTTPSPRGRIRASLLGPRSSDLSRGQSKECYPGIRHRDCSKNQYQTSTKKRQATLRLPAEILQQANGGREEDARATTLCMAWHAQQETSSCATIPTDTGRRGH